MKKTVLLALAAVALGTGSAVAQEVTYVEDCTQGLLINKNKNNWFLTVEGGSNIYFSTHDINAPIKDRLGANAGLYLGKWITPTFGFRFGANWTLNRGATTKGYEANGGMYRQANSSHLKTRHGDISSYLYPERMMGIGPEFDVLINLTNWWCGYKPNRVYNAILHGGAGAYWTFARDLKKGSKKDVEWTNVHNTFLFANIGLMNNFRLGKHVDLFIDLRYQLEDVSIELESQAAAYIGLNFNFGKTDWNCPVTAVCPTWKYTDAEGDALVAQLAAANNKISNLQEELDACLRRPVQQVAGNDCEGLATVYYPINQSSLSAREKTILKSVAEVMKNNADKKYILTGWADNYTGTEAINVRLRNARVDGVYNFLTKCGVSADQLKKEIDNNNLTDYGAKAAPLDRAVTIRLAN